MPQARRLVALLTLVLAMAGLGTVGGFTVQSAFATGVDNCPHDECEGSSRCVDNPGGGTLCNFEGSICKTKSCYAATPVGPAEPVSVE